MTNLLTQLEQKPTSTEEAFETLRLASNYWLNGDRKRTEDTYIPVLLQHHREHYEKLLEGSGKIIDEITREAGLFPYIKGKVTFADKLAMEFHKVPKSRDIMHGEQFRVYQEILKGKNVVLQAPTSFGKTYIADVAISILRPNIIVMVVPTISLLSERRRALELKFPDYAIVSHPFEDSRKEKVIFLGTQERLAQRADIHKIDLLVVDEFYKLLYNRKDTRSRILNSFVSKAIQKSKQYIFLSPPVPELNLGKGDFTSLRTDFSPVYVKVIEHPDKKGDNKKLKELILDAEKKQVFCYFKSPPAAQKTVLALDTLNFPKNEITSEIANYFSKEIHKDWLIPNAMKRGIGLHHGRNLRSVNEIVVRLYDKEFITKIFCTSSLIEGVNTNTEVIIIHEPMINNSNLDPVTLNNIKGRAGRMFKHFVGVVHVLGTIPVNKKPPPELPLLDNDFQKPDDLLFSFSDEYLSEDETSRKSGLVSNDLLPLEFYEDFSDFEVLSIEGLYQDLISDLESRPEDILWKGWGDYDKRTWLAEKVVSIKPKPSSVRSSRQLVYFLTELHGLTSLAKFFKKFTDKDYPRPMNEQIDSLFQFLRFCEYEFGRRISLIEAILGQLRKDTNFDYSYVATVASSWGLPGHLKSVSEYGIPETLLYKIQNHVDQYDPSSVLISLKTSKDLRALLSQTELKIIDLMLNKPAS